MGTFCAPEGRDTGGRDGLQDDGSSGDLRTAFSLPALPQLEGEGETLQFERGPRGPAKEGRVSESLYASGFALEF